MLCRSAGENMYLRSSNGSAAGWGREGQRVIVAGVDADRNRRCEHLALGGTEVHRLKGTGVAAAGANAAWLLSTGADLALHEDVGRALILELLHRNPVHVGHAVRGALREGVEGGIVAIIQTRLQGVGSIQTVLHMRGSAVRDGDAVASKFSRHLQIETRHNDGHRSGRRSRDRVRGVLVHAQSGHHLRRSGVQNFRIQGDGSTRSRSQRHDGEQGRVRIHRCHAGAIHLRREDRRDVIIGVDERDARAGGAVARERSFRGVVEIQDLLDVFPGGRQLNEIFDQRTISEERATRTTSNFLKPEIRSGITAVASPVSVIPAEGVRSDRLSVVFFVGVLLGNAWLDRVWRVGRIPPRSEVGFIRAARQGAGARLLLQTGTFGGLRVERRGGVVDVRPGRREGTMDSSGGAGDVRHQPIVGLDVAIGGLRVTRSVFYGV